VLEAGRVASSCVVARSRRGRVVVERVATVRDLPQLAFTLRLHALRLRLLVLLLWPVVVIRQGLCLNV